MERLKDTNKNETLSKADAEKEEAFAVPYTDRRAWSDFSILESLTPERLASILRDVRAGENPADYLELAQDIELKDLHYRSVLSTRKDAVCGLDIKITPASDDKLDVEIADAVRSDIVQNRNAKLRPLIRDMMDALAKGFSVNEIIWDTSSTTWKPKQYKYRDPRWFQYDKETGTQLRLRDELGGALHIMHPLKYIIHEPHLISGLPIVTGLAFPALFYWMLKNYDVTSWAAFIDRYGYPIRLGKYGSKATEDDIKTLKRAVAAIGSDFGAVIPESAVLEIVQASATAETSGAYKDMAVWVDKQISKLVLGQTMTTDEGSSRAQSQTHEEVRDDIADADLAQVMDTLNSQLVMPYVHFNYGAVEQFPLLELYKPDEKNIEQVVNAVTNLGPLGLTVKADEMRSLLGLSNPEEGDAVIGGKVEMLDTAKEDEKAEPKKNSTELNAWQSTSGTDDVEELTEETQSDYVEISDDIAEVLEKASDKATDFESFKAELEKLVIGWKPNKIAEVMALAFFKARATGDNNFEDK